MKLTSAVYVLEPNLDDPRFHGFLIGPGAKSVLGNERPYQDLIADDTESLDWQPKRLGAVWSPMPVKGTRGGKVSPFNDYPCLEVAEPVFSQRAVNALGAMLTDNGELLPLQTDVGDYYLYNILTKLDVLDVKKSRMERVNQAKTALTIDYFVFKQSKLEGATIFRVVEHPYIYLVTDQFKERAEEAALNGLNFIKVWPLPVDSDWGMEEAVRRRTQKKVTLVGEALTICFMLKKQTPSAAEKSAATELVESLRARLLPSSVEEKYWGSVESAEFVDGEYRIACTCPSCEGLAEHLQDWLDRADWPNGVAVVKRYGNLYFGRPKQKRIEIRKV